MKVSTFGTLLLENGEARLTHRDLGGVKPKQILEILILARGHLVSTDRLVEHLWPSSAPLNATATINTYVSVLRSRMFTDRERARRTLVTASRGYRLETSELVLDLQQVDHLLLRSERATRSDRIKDLSDAVSFVTGDLFEDAPYDAWVQEERARYRDRTTRAYNSLSREWLIEHEPSTALRCAEAALSLSPHCEESVRMAMLSNYALGYADVARRVYRDACQRLSTDLGVEPAADTSRLVWAIDSGIALAEIVNQLGSAVDKLSTSLV